MILLEYTLKGNGGKTNLEESDIEIFPLPHSNCPVLYLHAFMTHCQMHSILLTLFNQHTKGSNQFHTTDWRSKPHVQPPAHAQTATQQRKDCWHTEVTHGKLFT